MPTNDSKRSKEQVLRGDGALNTSPNKVKDPKFREGEFFDPRDIVQVRYEMLRRVLVDNTTVTEAAEEYGVSRPTFYQARASFEEAGVVGLSPRKRGPKESHKLRGDVLEYLEGQVVPGQPLRARQLAEEIRGKFGLDVHPRTIERTVSRVKKTTA